MTNDPLARRAAMTVLPLLLIPAALTGCGTDATAGDLTPAAASAKTARPAVRLPERGRLVSVAPLASLSPRQVRSRLVEGEFGAAPTRRGVKAYKITYRTSDDDGRGVDATGVLALPSAPSAAKVTVVYTHGTQSYRGEAASRWTDAYAEGPLLAAATRGLPAIAPDYVGLGDGTGKQAWMDPATEAAATTDLLTAARSAARHLDRPLARAVDVVGFSEGASAALATAERATAHRVKVDRVVAISGAYDFAGSELPALLSGQVDPRNAVPYLTLMLVSWNRHWHLYRHPSELFAAPYSDRVERLFDGTTPGQEMMSQLPGTIDELLTERGRRLLAHPTGPFAAALKEADSVCGWTSRTRVDLYRAHDDEQAVAANTDVCATWLRHAGSRVRVTDLGTPTTYGSRHLGTNVVGTLRALDEFAD